MGIIIVKYLFLICFFDIFLLSNEITAEIKTKSIPPSSNVLDLPQQSNVPTLEDRLENDISFYRTTNNYNEKDVSFRGVSNRAIGYTEDLIPLFRSTGGLIGVSTIYSRDTLVANMGSSPSAVGVTSMGGDIDIISTKPAKEMEGNVGASVGRDESQYYFYVGSKQKNYYIQLNGLRDTRDSYSLSENFATTSEQPSRQRLNSDLHRSDVAFKVGYQIDETNDMAFKIETNRGSHGIEPNVFYNNGGSGYQRINRKDLDSYYFYFNHKTSQLEANLRIYRDNYKDVYDFYTDNTYSPLKYNSSLYDDSRTGVLGKISYKTSEANQISYVANIENNEHIWKVDGEATHPRFVYQAIKNSLIDELRFGSKFKLDSAVTYSTFKPLSIQNTNTPTAASFSAIDGQLKGTYIFDSSAIYASLAKTSRAPSMSEMFAFFPWDVPNNNLKPESAMQYEAGYKYFFGKKSTISLAVFHYDIKNKILYDSNMYQNLDSATHDGFEFRYGNRYYENNSFDINYAYAKTKDSNGNSLELIPRQKISFSDKIKLFKGLCTMFIVNYNDKMQTIYNGNKYNISPYITADTTISHETKSGTTVAIGIKNILDRNYYVKYGYPADGRRIELSANIKF